MVHLLAFLYFVLGVFIAAVEIRRMRTAQPFDALSFFNGAYFLFFVFMPLNVLVLGEDAIRQKYAYQTWSHGDVGTVLALGLSYALFVAGYYWRSKNQTLRKVAGSGVYGMRTAMWLVFCFFLIGGIGMAYHVVLVGGVIDALRFAPQVRTGEFQLEGQALFVRQFTAFLATAFMLGWTLYIDAARKISEFYRQSAILLLGLVFVYYALSTYGRREFLYPMIICLIVWAQAGRHRLWGGLGWLLVLCIFWFSAYSFIIPAAAPSAAAPSAADFLRDLYFRTIQGLGDSFMHFVAAQHASLWQFGFLSDIWEMPLQFLPSKLLGFERPRGMFGATSEYILGRPLESGLSGEEPLGLHGYLLVNFSYLGMFLIFYLLGIGYRAMDAVLRPERGGSALRWLIYLWAIVGALEFLREGVLILVLKPRFSWWLAMGILLWFGYRHSAKARPSHEQSFQQIHTP